MHGWIFFGSLNHEVCAVQIMKDLVDVSAEEMLNIVIAYEPVWAIGTGNYYLHYHHQHIRTFKQF